MGHATSKKYIDLQKRLDDAIQGVPASETLFKILKILFTEEEAGLASVLPLKFFTVEEAANRWKKPIKETSEILNTLANKGILLDLAHGNTQKHVIAPPMAGFIEFSLMRTDGMFDSKILAELYHQYLNVEPEFVKQTFSLSPPIDRVFVQENTIKESEKAEVLDYEKTTHTIETASMITVSTCYCRHKLEHLGKACDAPQDVCLTFNGAAESLSKHGIAKEITKTEALEILERCVKLGLVQVGDNVQERVSWICNCCGCCCEALIAYKKLGCISEIHSNFLATVDTIKCTSCGICVKCCPVSAISFDNLTQYTKKQVKIDKNICIGCGVCANFCPSKSLLLQRKDEVNFVPVDTAERVILTAINTGELQNYVFDNYNLWTYKMLRRFLKTILNLSPVKRALANDQLRSKYIGAAIRASLGAKHTRDYSHPELRKK